MTTTTTVSLDPRGRTSLAKLTKHRLFTAHVEDSGRIVLEPAVMVSAQALYDSNLDIQEEIATAEAGSATIRPRPAR